MVQYELVLLLTECLTESAVQINMRHLVHSDKY